VFSYGPLEIQSYTVCMLAVVLLGGWLTYREAQRRGRLNEDTLMVGAVGPAGRGDWRKGQHGYLSGAW
jgi:prolipoprotein diacylglyceryltransferase